MLGCKGLHICTEPSQIITDLRSSAQVVTKAQEVRKTRPLGNLDDTYMQTANSSVARLKTLLPRRFEAQPRHTENGHVREQGGAPQRAGTTP